MILISPKPGVIAGPNGSRLLVVGDLPTGTSLSVPAPDVPLQELAVAALQMAHDLLTTPDHPGPRVWGFCFTTLDDGTRAAQIYYGLYDLSQEHEYILVTSDLPTEQFRDLLETLTANLNGNLAYAAGDLIDQHLN